MSLIHLNLVSMNSTALGLQSDTTLELNQHLKIQPKMSKTTSITNYYIYLFINITDKKFFYDMVLGALRGIRFVLHICNLQCDVYIQ